MPEVQAEEASPDAGTLQRALLESEDRFFTVFANAPIGMAICSPSGSYLRTNPAFATMLGYSEADLREKSIQSVTHPDDVEANFEEIEKLIAGEAQSICVEKRYIRKDGAVIWAEVSVALVRDTEGLPRHLIVQARDVTARRAAEQARRRTHQHLKEAERIGGLGSWEWNIKNDRVHWSEEMYRIFGLPLREFGATAQSYLARVHPDDRAFVQNEIERSLRDHVPFLHDNRIVRPDGTVRILRSRGEVKLDASGTPAQMLGVCQDMTEIRQAEAALRESEQRFEAIVETVADGITISDTEGRIVLANAEAGRILGLPREEILGRTYADPRWKLTTREGEPYRGAEDLFRRALETGAQASEVIGVERPDGTRVLLSIRTKALEGPDGEPAGVVTSFTDITEEQRVQDALRESERTLERRVAARTRALSEANQELDAFVHSMSHDLRAPLRGMLYHADALEADAGAQLGAEARADIERLRNEGRRMATLIASLLTMARTAGGEIHRTPVDLSEMVRIIVDGLQRDEPDRLVDVVIQPGVAAKGDASFLAVVLQNLLSNAWKFTRGTRDARIEFGATQREGRPAYFVRDNGVGFDMSQADRLFHPFQRLHSRDQFEGTGIGLATVQRIVARHGGKVWAEGRPGKGATFSFAV